MCYLSESRNLSEGSFGYSLRFRLQFDLLQGNNLLGGSVHALVYGTVSTLTKGADLLQLVDPTQAVRVLHGIVHR